MGLLRAFFLAVLAITLLAVGLFLLFRRPRSSAGRPAKETDRATPRPTSDVIDVTATEVPTDPKKP